MGDVAGGWFVEDVVDHGVAEDAGYERFVEVEF